MVIYQTLTMALTKERFPLLFQDKEISISDIELFVKVKPEFASSHNDGTMKLSLEAEGATSNNELALAPWNGLFRAEKTPAGSPGNWTLTSWLDSGNKAHNRLDPNAIQEILVVCRYTCT